jgi:biotin carboxyl carrier protein
VEPTGDAPVIPVSAPVARQVVVAKQPANEEAPKVAAVDGEPIVAPMPGMIIEYQVKMGDKVATGDPIVILEAMKMQNTLSAPVSGKIVAINAGPGASVAKDDVLAVIKP